MRIPIAILSLCLAPAIAFAQPNFEVPKAVPIDAETLAKIESKMTELKGKLPAYNTRGLSLVADPADVEVYYKAAEWMVRHGEFFTKDTAKQTLAVLDAGIERATQFKSRKAPWKEVRGKPVIFGFRSRVDQSIQPFAVTLPVGFESRARSVKYPIDLVLHGRDQSLTEVKFIDSRDRAKAGPAKDRITIEVYGRGNNAYRWAGERDVYEALDGFCSHHSINLYKAANPPPPPVFLRGFSMGGAGTWHIGLHDPLTFRAVSPGAGFTATHGYIKNLPELPDYQERCLTIYDAVNYAENAFNVPVIAYSGEKDPQKAAADNIETALKAFKEPMNFQHLVAPGLEHKQPPEWLAKIEAEFAKLQSAEQPRIRERIHFVTHTLAYPSCDWIRIEGLERHYDRAVVDATWKQDRSPNVTTKNVAILRIQLPQNFLTPRTITIDGIELPFPSNPLFIKDENGKWILENGTDDSKIRKRPGQQGPIDDAFRSRFRVSGPTKAGWSDATDAHAKASLARFGYEWDKYFRGKLPIEAPVAKADFPKSAILFGDPSSNPEIAAMLRRLPIQWTAEKLVVNGVEYDSKTHVPAMIYPFSQQSSPAFFHHTYVVLNSGHTFHAAELKGTNAQLYPRLGDWAVLKPTPTKADPAAAEVVAAGIFDENWQFVK